MNTKFKGKNIEVTEAIKDYADKKLKRMDKYFEEEEATVTIYTEGDKQVVEIQINAGVIYRAESKEADLYASIDKSIDILEGQVRKTKSKNEKRMKEDSIKSKAIEGMNHPEEITGEIVKSSYYSVKPMSIEDAKLELESKIKSQFLAFVDVDTNKVCVMFKTKDGKNFGIVEPEV